MQVIFLFVALLLVIFFFIQVIPEKLCVNKPYGAVTDTPASNYIDVNAALARATSLGQKPLGDPRYWLPNRSPITQGQWGLYQPGLLPLDQTQNFDRSKLTPIFQTLPVYTNPEFVLA